MVKNTADQEAHGRSIALMKFLSGVAKRLGVAEHVYVVGGAVRNFLIDQPIKDIDVVIDSVAAGHDSEWFAQQVARAIPAKTNLTTNNYGVAILSIEPSWVLDGYSMAGPKGTGETIEIANARKESYGGETGKGYKPHLVEPATIEEDLVRREFTFNTLLWRLSDLAEGPDKAEVIDMLGGRKDLSEGVMRTPVNPDKTFSDDPTRMLRAIKFVAKYGFRVPPDMAASIRKNAPKLKGMPWDAVRKIVTEDILDAPNPRKSTALLQDLGLADVLREMMQAEPGFAAAMGRSLSDKEALLLLDLLDLGWATRTPIGFLDKAGQKRLRGILLSMDDAEGKAFVDALVKPPINQPRLFEEYGVPPKERQQVAGLARQFLLDDPTLAGDARGLEALVEEALSRRMPKVAAERVVARFVARGGR